MQVKVHSFNSKRRENTVKFTQIVPTAFLLVFLGTTAQGQNIFSRVNEHPIIPSPLSSTPELKKMIQDTGQELAAAMQKTGQGDLFTLVRLQFENYPQTDIQRVYYRPGQHFLWMLYRRNGQGPIMAVKDVAWGGEEAVLAFEFPIYLNSVRYIFALLPSSGNLLLKEVDSPVPGPTIHFSDPDPVQIPPPKVSTPKKVVQYVDRPVEVVKEVPVEVVKEVPVEVVKYVDRPVEVVKEVPVEVVKYVDRPVKVVQKVPKEVIKYVDRPVEVKVPVPAVSRTRFVVDAGYLKQPDPADYGLGRIGIEYPLSERFSFMALAGGAVQAKGSDGMNAFVLDFFLNYNMQCQWPTGTTRSPMFMGIGLGGWMTSGDKDNPAEDSDVDLILNVGSKLYGEDDDFTVSLFLEARSALDEFDKIADYGRFGGGLRFRF
jgi:hypothetical protein